MVNIFLSGKFADKQSIKQKICELESMGYKITHDWTTHELPSLTSFDGLQEAAIGDINGVKDCDVHILVMTDKEYPYRGTFAELGCSLGLGKRIMIYCPLDDHDGNFKRVPFYHHPLVEHYNDWNLLLHKL